MDLDETGKDGTLIVNGEEFPFTNQSLTISWDTSDSDYNDKTETHHRKTSKSTEGEIEVDGSVAELKAAIMNENGEQRDDIRIQMSGSEGGDRLTGVTVTEFGREYPGGDATTTTISVVANNHRPIDLGA